MRERVCALQEGIYVNEASLVELASQDLSSVFSFTDVGGRTFGFFSLRLVLCAHDSR